MKKYNLSIISMFKNESEIIEEWIIHYLKEGVNHFYLIDNGSTDNYIHILNKYSQYIDLIVDDFRSEKPGTQNILINKHFKEKIISETEWILICDIDEYVYNRENYKTISFFLDELQEKISQIILPWKIFSSNNNIETPNSLISNLTMCGSKIRLEGGYCKSITRTSKILNLECHRNSIKGGDIIYSNLCSIKEDYNIKEQKLALNHYMFISENYYKNIKCERGGGQSNKSSKYTMSYFLNNDNKYNDNNDIELKEKIYKE